MVVLKQETLNKEVQGTEQETLGLVLGSLERFGRHPWKGGIATKETMISSSWESDEICLRRYA